MHVFGGGGGEEEGMIKKNPGRQRSEVGEGEWGGGGGLHPLCTIIERIPAAWPCRELSLHLAFNR